jgi:hypothetical protein
MGPRYWIGTITADNAVYQQLDLAYSAYYRPLPSYLEQYCPSSACSPNF